MHLPEHFSCKIVSICVLAIPTLRRKRHDLFEYSHRFVGWSALLTLWAFVLVTVNSPGEPLSLDSVLRSPEFWLAVLTTGLIFSPWLTVRKDRVQSRALSSAVVEITFAGGSRPGSFGRISRHLLSDWHSFALVSTEKLTT